MLYSFQYDNFYKPYNKLNSEFIPSCCDTTHCEKCHKNINPKEISSFSNGPFFNILDNPLVNWVYDVSVTAFSILRPDQFFRGDVLRILFHYILDGPLEVLMWDIKHVVSSHFEIHPPCSSQMRQFYFKLLFKPHEDDSFFKTELTGLGVLQHVIGQLEHYFNNNSATPNANTSQSEKLEASINQEETKADEITKEITLEKMEERWRNYEPLLDNEYIEVFDALDHLSQSSHQETEVVVNQSSLHTSSRLIVALELLVDLLEADFQICVAKLKQYIMGKNHNYVTPFMEYFGVSDHLVRVLTLYTSTTNQSLWKQLSRLIGMIAEQEHLFQLSLEKLWQYPALHPDCATYTSSCLITAISKCKWSEEERLLRLRSLHPPWLQLKVAMNWANTELNVQMGKDLKALVDIIHMNIKSPIPLERPAKRALMKNVHLAMSTKSTQLTKRATKKNQYGETLLHRLFKNKKTSMVEIHSVLILPEINVNARDNYGWTPLHEAVASSSTLKTKTLLQYQPPPGKSAVEIDAQNCKGFTPLHEAVVANSLELCQLLVSYGGVCLLRKTDFEGQTPLHLAKEKKEIHEYFKGVLEKQEQLNLSYDSELNLSDYLIQLLIVAFEAFESDYHTWKLYCMMKFDEHFENVTPEKWIVADQNTLLRAREDQHQIKKLIRILNKLACNMKNSKLVQLWDAKFQTVPFGDKDILLDAKKETKPLSEITDARIMFEELLQLKKHLTDSPKKKKPKIKLFK